MASISHSSTLTGVPPSEVTASTITSAPCLCAICVRSFASDWQPVEVSACTKATSFASLFFFSASSSFCGSTGSPHLSRSEEHTSELQSRLHLVCRLLLEKKKEIHIKCYKSTILC